MLRGEVTFDARFIENPPFVGEDNPLGRPAWFSFVKSEYEGCRERVGIMDMSNFSKFELVVSVNRILKLGSLTRFPFVEQRR